jgi:hypothetical protein
MALISVSGDGVWATRSFYSKYRSLSGASTLIGIKTKKCIFLDVRNSYCFTCDNTKTPTKPHQCSKNFKGPPTAMESKGITSAFLNSEKQGIRYVEYVGDGDSSVFPNILKCRPYRNTKIKRLQCTHHLLRNFRKRLYGVALKSVKGKGALMQLLKKNVLRTSKCVTAAAAYRREENVIHATKMENLKQDIQNIPKHIFGEHENCATYFCSGAKEGEENIFQNIKDEPIFKEYVFPFKRLIQKMKGIAYW